MLMTNLYGRHFYCPHFKDDEPERLKIKELVSRHKQ